MILFLIVRNDPLWDASDTLLSCYVFRVGYIDDRMEGLFSKSTQIRVIFIEFRNLHTFGCLVASIRYENSLLLGVW